MLQKLDEAPAEWVTCDTRATDLTFLHRFTLVSRLQVRAKKALDAANNELEINLDNALKVTPLLVFVQFQRL